MREAYRSGHDVVYVQSLARAAHFFYEDVPKYSFELRCTHVFVSRTPLTERNVLWCSTCADYRRAVRQVEVRSDTEMSYLQDGGILRERVAAHLDGGFLSTDEEIEDMSRWLSVPIDIVRRINAWRTRIEIRPGGLPTLGRHATGRPMARNYGLCASGLHVMTENNMAVTIDNRVRCRACRTEKQRYRRAARRKLEAK